MADAAEHGELLLSAIIPGRRDLLEQAVRVLQPEHFVDSTQSRMFAFLYRYYERTGGGVVTESALEDMSRLDDSGRAQALLETYLLFSEQESGDEQFAWSLDQLRELYEERLTNEVVANAIEIIRTGRTMEDGERLHGAAAARTYAASAFTQIERSAALEAAPEGDTRQGRQEFLSLYESRKQARENGTARGILTGVETIDQRTGGMQPGEVVLVAGYVGDGKTSFVVQTAWHAAVKQRKNVVFFTTETVRETVFRRIVARHSMEPQFELSPDGLNSADLKNAVLTEAQEGKLGEVLNDFETGDYGRLYVAQVPRGATMTYLEMRLNALQREFDIDLVIVDSLYLLHSDRRRQTSREEYAGIMTDAKGLAVTFNNGKGVPIMSPWQVTRAAREQAEKDGQYKDSSLSETSESTRTADIIFGLLAPTDNTSRRCDALMQIMKNRDGPEINNLRVRIDYATSTFSNGFNALSSGGFNESQGIDSLLN